MERIDRTALGATAALALLTLAAACGGTHPLDSVDSGRTFSYAPGTPSFDLEAIATWRDQAAGLDVYISIPYRSLAYMQAGGRYEGRFEWVLQLRDATGEQVVWEDAENRTLTVATYDSTQLFVSVLLYRRVPATTGTYVVQASIEDKVGGQTAVRAQRIEVVDWSSSRPALSRVRLEARHQGRPFEPVLTPHLPENLDSLRAVVEFYNAPDRVDLQMVLVEPRADMAPAEPPYWFQGRNDRFTFEGLDFRRADTLQLTRRTLRAVPREVTVAFNLPPLEEGVYRLELSAEVEGGDAPAVERRDFTVKGKDFPRVTTLDEMVEALVYVARGRELKAMVEAPTVEAKHAAFEAFWLSRARNARDAADLLKRYYSRVEEANLLFSSYKRGWKTDQGMVYIVMGPPDYVDHRFGEGRPILIWRYPPPQQGRAPMGYYPMDPNRSPVSQLEVRYIFEEARKLDPSIPYPQFVLRRSRVYQSIWEDAVSLWRTGRTL